MGKKVKTKELSEEQRGIIVGLEVAGWSYSRIAAHMGCGKSAVSKLLKKYRETGSVKNLKRSGRPRATTPSQDKHIRVTSLMDRFRSAHDISRDVIVHKTKKNVSVSTVKKRLQEAGLNGRVARNKPKLTKKQRMARLEWAKKYRSWSKSDWEKVLWSDESPFTLFIKGGKVFVRRREWETYAPCCMQPTVKFGGGHINVWGCFSAQGVESLYQINGIMTGAMYREILKNQMAPVLRRLGADFKFQQDNDPKHKSKVVQRYLSNAKFTVLDWPSQSPDLNPIENLWGQIKQQLRKLPVGPKSLDGIYAFVKREWESLERDYLLTLVHSMPSRIEAVIKNKGYATKY